jgi:thiamine biosynthesis protein ThiS
MHVTVNSEPRELKGGTTLADLIRDSGLADAPCAAEINKALVPKRDHPARQLQDGDTIELVTLVGGG